MIAAEAPGFLRRDEGAYCWSTDARRDGSTAKAIDLAIRGP